MLSIWNILFVVKDIQIKQYHLQMLFSYINE